MFNFSCKLLNDNDIKRFFYTKGSTIMVVVDHPENARRLDEAMQGRRLSLDVLLDIDVGLGRTGVLPESALELTGHITNSSNLQLKGIQAYAGFGQHT